MFQYDHLALKQNVLYWLYIHQDLEYHQLVLPQRYQARVLKALHDDMGHQGLERTLALLHERVYWPSMAKDAAMWIDHCHRCQVAKGTYNEPQPKLGDLIANNPLDLLCIDFTKVDPSRNGKENVLVMTDAFTKFSQAVVTPNQKAVTVAKILVDKWFHIYGIPARLHSDQGKSFDNEVVKQLCKMYGIKKSMMMPYNPRGNSQCERFNCTMFGLLKSLSREQKTDWPVHLSTMTFAYNATPHTTTGFQPYELMFRCKALAPCNVWLGLHEYNDKRSINKAAWVDQQLERIISANRRALKQIKAQVKKNHDIAGGKDLLIPVGNLVLLRDHPEGRKKIQDANKSELFVVTGLHKQQPNVYYIRALDGKSPVKTVNRRQLFDLGITQREELRRNEEMLTLGEYQDVPLAPVYNPEKTRSKVKNTSFEILHPYNTRSKGPIMTTNNASMAMQSTKR